MLTTKTSFLVRYWGSKENERFSLIAREAQRKETIMEALLPYWLTDDLVIIGAEEDPSGDDGSSEGDGDEGDESDSGDSGGDSSSSDSDGDNLEGLKAALRRERQINRENTRKLNRLERQTKQKTDAEQSELERTKEELASSTTRTQQLAEGFLKVQLDRLIEKAASKAKFRDTDDALRMVDRSLITYDQDDENPSDIDVDEKTVEEAVKKLAAAKRHLITSGTDDGEPTGGQFGTKKGKKPTTEEELQRKYPSL